MFSCCSLLSDCGRYSAAHAPHFPTSSVPTSLPQSMLMPVTLARHCHSHSSLLSLLLLLAPRGVVHRATCRRVGRGIGIGVESCCSGLARKQGLRSRASGGGVLARQSSEASVHNDSKQRGVRPRRGVRCAVRGAVVHRPRRCARARPSSPPKVEATWAPWAPEQSHRSRTVRFRARSGRRPKSRDGVRG